MFAELFLPIHPCWDSFRHTGPSMGCPGDPSAGVGWMCCALGCQHAPPVVNHLSPSAFRAGVRPGYGRRLRKQAASESAKQRWCHDPQRRPRECSPSCWSCHCRHPGPAAAAGPPAMSRAGGIALCLSMPFFNEEDIWNVS